MSELTYSFTLTETERAAFATTKKITAISMIRTMKVCPPSGKLSARVIEFPSPSPRKKAA